MSLNLFVRFKARGGRVRKWLKRHAPTWLSSPWRRAIQAAAFLIFLALFFHVAWPYGSPDYATHLDGKEIIEAESFLALDPLVAVSTAIAARTWVWSLVWAGVILLVGVVFPRGFCGYLCPLGTLIDVFDWLVGKRVKRFQLPEGAAGWWVHIKYYLLTGTLVAAVFGVLVSGFVAAIPVVTRGLLFAAGPLETGIRRDWYLIPPMNAGHVVSLVLFVAVLAMGLWRPRFWCRYVCPTGAMFSVGNLFRASERKVESTCINCNKCVEICPFDAIKGDYTTRTADCTLCQTCGGVCPTHAIKFVSRWNTVQLKVEGNPPTSETGLSRRGFLAGTGGALAVAAGAHGLLGNATPAGGAAVVRPPGSVPEAMFLDLCIRCGECFKACPNNVLQPVGFEDLGRGLWTPKVVADWAGCEPSCNNCGQVCPTGAIRALPIEEKRVARMGFAVVNETTCLPFAGVEACQMCVDECNAAGYEAIEFVRVQPNAPRASTDPAAMPEPAAEGEIESVPEGEFEPEPMFEDGPEVGGPTPLPEPAAVESAMPADEGFLAPQVDPLKCVGCGLCQTRCFQINAKAKGLLAESAIIIEAGPDPETRVPREDRIRRGSYVQLRTMREQKAEAERKQRIKDSGGDGSYLPDFLLD